MSTNIAEINTRLRKMQHYWSEHGLATIRSAEGLSEKVKQSLLERYEDPFSAAFTQCETEVALDKIAVKKLLQAFRIIDEMLRDLNLPETLTDKKNGTLDHMRQILKGELGDDDRHLLRGPLDITPEVKNRKITLFSRNTRHKAFMKDHQLTNNVNSLRIWLKDFYCKQYLQGDSQDQTKQDKAEKILHHIYNTNPPAGTSVYEYMTLFGTPSLATIMGENRQSHSAKKVPWGLQKIQESFGYKIEPDDIKAKPRTPKPTKTR